MFTQRSPMKATYVTILLFILIGLLSGCSNNEEGNVKTYHRWFNVSDGDSSMYTLNETGPKAYQYRIVRAPTDAERSQFSVATVDGLPRGIDDPNYEKRVSRGKLSAEQIDKLTSLFSEEKVKKYAEGQNDSTVAECRKKSPDRLVITWFIGSSDYAACWQKDQIDKITDKDTKAMIEYVKVLKDSLANQAVPSNQ